MSKNNISMKKLLFRNLLINYMSFFLIALLSATTVIWIFQAVNFLILLLKMGEII